MPLKAVYSPASVFKRMWCAFLSNLSIQLPSNHRESVSWGQGKLRRQLWRKRSGDGGTYWAFKKILYLELGILSDTWKPAIRNLGILTFILDDLMSFFPGQEYSALPITVHCPSRACLVAAKEQFIRGTDSKPGISKLIGLSLKFLKKTHKSMGRKYPSEHQRQAFNLFVIHVHSILYCSLWRSHTINASSRSSISKLM